MNSCLMEDLSEPLLGEIIKRLTRTSDLKSISLVSKQLYTAEANERGTIHVGCGLYPATEALTSLCYRFPNLWKVEIDYSGWSCNQGNQLDNQGLHVLSSHCPSLKDLTLRFCSFITDSGLGYLSSCKKLMALRLNFVPAITSNGLLSVAIGCTSLSILHLTYCMKVGSVDEELPQHRRKLLRCGSSSQQRKLELTYSGNTGVEWLEHLGKAGSLVELVIKDCKEISQYDLLETNYYYWIPEAKDPWYNVGYPYKYDICCENMKDLRLAKIITKPEIGLRFLLGICNKSLEKLCLHYVIGLNDSEMITLFQNCRNLRSISIRLMPTDGRTVD